MQPQRPYLLKAFYDWLLDSELTPHIVVDANYHDVDVPFEFAKDGQIVLNIAPQAVGRFEMTHDYISFTARFGGVPRQVYIPMGAILAVYARENGAGTMFQPEEFYDNEPVITEEKPKTKIQLVEDDEKHEDSPDDEPPQPPKGRPSLRIVK